MINDGDVNGKTAVAGQLKQLYFGIKAIGAAPLNIIYRSVKNESKVIQNATGKGININMCFVL